MRAFAVRPGRAGSGALMDLPEPAADGERCLVGALEVGLCGTDREIAAGEYGRAPPQSEWLVLGHESFGVVLEKPKTAAASFNIGDVVVATVRRGCPQNCAPCRAGHPDFCTTGEYRERGIRGLDGFLSERFLESPAHLLAVPADLQTTAVLVEPLSTVEKAFRLANSIQQRLDWHPQRAIVTGAGPVGLLAALIARLRDLDVLLYSKGEPDDARNGIFDRAGIVYADANVQTLAQCAAQFGPADLFVEATGYSPLAWQGISVLDRNGVACLLSITGGDLRQEIPSDALNLALVLGNRVVFGSVSAQRQDYEQAVRDLQDAEARWPQLLPSFVTERVALDDVAKILAAPVPGELKIVVQINDPRRIH